MSPEFALINAIIGVCASSWLSEPNSTIFPDTSGVSSSSGNSGISIASGISDTFGNSETSDSVGTSGASVVSASAVCSGGSAAVGSSGGSGTFGDSGACAVSLITVFSDASMESALFPSEAAIPIPESIATAVTNAKIRAVTSFFRNRFILLFPPFNVLFFSAKFAGMYRIN